MPAREYHINFNTKEIPSGIKSTKVTLDSVWTLDQNKKFSINLCDDPLYPQLEAYVLANPTRKKRK